MKLQEGHKYRTREGEVVTVKRESNPRHPTHCFKDVKGYRTWNVDGEFCVDGVACPSDLVEEVFDNELEKYRNIKIHVRTPEESRRVQEFLFSKGCTWPGGFRSPLSITGNYILIDEEHTMYMGLEDVHFENHENKEVSVKELLGIQSAIHIDHNHWNCGVCGCSWNSMEEAERCSHLNTHTYTMTSSKKEEKTMELKDIKKENLAEAKKQFETERKNAEIESAKVQLRIAVDEIDRLDRKIKELQEEKKPWQEVIDQFKPSRKQ